MRDAQRTGVRHWFVIPCLVLTFLLLPRELAWGRLLLSLVLVLLVSAGLGRAFSVESVRTACPADRQRHTGCR